MNTIDELCYILKEAYM